MACRSELLKEVDLVDRRVDNAFRGIDGVKSGLEVQIAHHDASRETLSELKEGLKEVNKNVLLILQKRE